jgi:hypothetical protein
MRINRLTPPGDRHLRTGLRLDAATSEESAATAEELARREEELRALVTSLQLEGGEVEERRAA